jgi:hypothetical protein
MEDGAYTLNGITGDGGDYVQRNPGAKYFLTSEDEWYKAAYYKGGGQHAGYWDYPMQSDIPTMPSNDVIDPDPGNNSNYELVISEDPFVADYSIGGPYWRTLPGEFENSESAYGTYDQGGNVWEWNEAVVVPGYRSIRGGSFIASEYIQQSAGVRSHIFEPRREWRTLGFRVAAPPTPPIGINTRAVYDPMMSSAAANYSFKVWGEVTTMGYYAFTVGMPVKVVTPEMITLQDGEYACASGVFSGEGANKVLSAEASNIRKLQ